jgi:MoxR-like ATPase
MLPSDILGVTVWDQQKSEFVFKPGPIFNNIILSDEINRTTPRTQSALLEAMNDAQVSVDGETRKLVQPFTVLATQNPYEFEGTYIFAVERIVVHTLRTVRRDEDRVREDNTPLHRAIVVFPVARLRTFSTSQGHPERGSGLLLLQIDQASNLRAV